MHWHDWHGGRSQKKVEDDTTLQFLLLLTRTLGYRSMAELVETMDSDEYCLWVAEFERSPWDETRGDLRAGVISSAIANYAGKVRKDKAPPAKPIEFMPYHQPEPEVIQPDFSYLKNFLSDKYGR